MIRLRRPGLLACSFTLALGALTPLTWGGPLDAKLRDLLSDIDLGGADVGVCVIDAATGDILASRNADKPLIPASNQKLLTSAAALITLGPDFVFQTDLLLDASTLVIKGSGDPALGDPAILSASEPPMTAGDLLESLAAAVARAAPPTLDQIVVDDRVFDREWAHPSWPDKDLNRWYCAEIGGLNFHANVISVYVSPSPNGAGAEPTIEYEPQVPGISIENHARTIRTGRNTTWVARPRPTNDFTLYGQISSPLPEPILAAIHEPPTFTAKLLARELATAGVALSPSLADNVRLAEPADRFDEATPVARVTTRLSDVLRRCNTDSYNLYAEALLKRIGHEVTSNPGSWSNGATVVRMLLSERLGAQYASTTQIVDGSGMSRDNRVSTATLAAWLDMIADDPTLFEPFLASLATPGEGTLTSRFKNVQINNVIKAKSGYLDGVYSLSGYVIDPRSGHTVVFSLLLNERDRHTPNAKRFHEAFVAEIDKWLTKNAPITATAPTD
ncbi:MAG: D-alanyl-D-alanine carboxypeptidase/D-alanyl-D-alanine-endopeptidase [Phycisphaerales bacterium]